MPITTLDPVAALIVIDLQKGITAMLPADAATQIVARSAALADAFRKRGLPVVLVNVVAVPAGRTDMGPRNFNFPPDWTELVPELNQQPEDFLVSKQAPGAFIGTKLHEYLQERGVTQVFIIGIATSNGVEATARSARDHGYNVVLITDAMADRDTEAHRYSVENIFPKIAETGSAEALLTLLTTYSAR
jgi:nicotinamidase-related amidase